MLYLLTRQDFQPKWRVIDVKPDTEGNHAKMADEMARRLAENPHRFYRLVPYGMKFLYPTIDE